MSFEIFWNFQGVLFQYFHSETISVQTPNLQRNIQINRKPKEFKIMIFLYLNVLPLSLMDRGFEYTLADKCLS